MPAEPEPNKLLGRSAEDAALAFLESRGLSPLARNFRCRYGEIDLVMRDDDVVVFVEVRCRVGRSLASAAATVNTGKQDRLTKAAQAFLGTHPEFGLAVMRFDVIAFDRHPERHGPTAWLRDAFRPPAA